jgi:rubrerythrin
MGSSYEFTCRQCEYSAEVSGGDDAGKISATTTILCEDCKQLFDVMVSENPSEKSSYRDPVCPRDNNHKVRRWKHPDVCPKCGTQMEKGALTIDWD